MGDVRHLNALLTTAEGEGLKSVAPLGEEQVSAIKMINTYYRDKELEYIVTGFKRFPQVQVLHSSASTLLEGTKRVCMEGRTAQVRKAEHESDPRGEKDAIRDFEKIDLFRWWDPSELAEGVGPTSRQNDGRIIAEHRYQKHLEAWIASHFAGIYSRLKGVETKIKMVPDLNRTPDAIMRIMGKRPEEIGLEITTVLTPGRHFRAEYRERMEGRKQGMRPVRFPDPEEVAAWVNVVLGKKTRVADPRMGLVLYLNAEWIDTSDFAGHISPKNLDSWGEVHVLSSSGGSILTLKGDGPREWTRIGLGDLDE